MWDSSQAELDLLTYHYLPYFCFGATSNRIIVQDQIWSNLPLELLFFASTHEKKVNDTLNTLCLNSEGSLSPCWKSSHLQRGFVPANIGKLDPVSQLWPLNLFPKVNLPMLISTRNLHICIATLPQISRLLLAICQAHLANILPNNNRPTDVNLRRIGFGLFQNATKLKHMSFSSD